jgi:cobalamin biosynthesis protein CobW
MQDKIPATVITGFLGSGKTTMIRNILENANGRRIALIINEFGDLGVDGDVLRGCAADACSEDDIVELTNCCICCTVADDFIPTMTKLLEKDRRVDHIIIETSGLALPQPLVAAFNWPEVKTRVTVDGVITVIDAAAVAAGRFADDEEALAAQRSADPSFAHDNPVEEVFSDQIMAADLIVLNKSDLLSAAAMAEVKAQINAGAPRPLKIVSSEQGKLPLDVLLGLGSGTEDLIAGRKSHHEIEHEGGEAHDHDDFVSFVVESDEVSSAKEFAKDMRMVIENHDILRMKGFVAVRGKPMRLVLQAVGGRVDTYYDRPWRKGEERVTRLVVIAQNGVDKLEVESSIFALSF